MVALVSSGDAAIYGMGGPLFQTLLAQGWDGNEPPVEVVPGVTAAQGAASRLGVPLTQRGVTRRVQYVTGHGEGGHLPKDLDWQSLGDPAATTVVYMPTKTLSELAARAIRAGLDPATPAIAIARATQPDEAMTADRIANLPARLAANPPRGPVLVLIGRVFAEYAAEADLARAAPLRDAHPG